MTQDDFDRMLLVALQHPRIQTAIIRLINERTGKARRRVVANARNNAGTLAPKGLSAVTPLTKSK